MTHELPVRTTRLERLERRPASPPAADDAQQLPRLDELGLTELVLPEQANHYGTLFGPNGLALLGKAAFLVATRFTRLSMVMAAANRIEFMAPVPVGVLLGVTARITRVGRSSLTATVSAWLDTETGTRAPEVLRGEFEMVAVDRQGRPCVISAWQPAPGAPPAPLTTHSSPT